MATMVETPRALDLGGSGASPAMSQLQDGAAMGALLNGALLHGAAANSEGNELGEAAEAVGMPSPRKWQRQWVPVETVLNNGKLFVLKWVTAEESKVPHDPEKPVDTQTPPVPRGLGAVYVCHVEACGKVFLEAGALRKHSHVHGERQYICQYEGCGKKFVDSSKLKRHHLIHTGEKHFICPFEGCGKAFSLDFNRRSHMRTHTGENYHSCPVLDCGKRFAHENKLRAHMQTAHPDKDNGGDSEKEEQQEAKRGEEGPVDAEMDRPYECPHSGCGKRYIHAYKLNLHLKKEHQGPTEDTNGDGPGKAGGGKPVDGDSEEDERENMPLILSRAADYGVEGEPKKRRRRKKKDKEEDAGPPQKKRRGRPPKDKAKVAEKQTKATPAIRKMTFVESRAEEVAREPSPGESSEGLEGSDMGGRRAVTEEVEEEVMEMEEEEEEGEGGEDDMGAEYEMEGRGGGRGGGGYGRDEDEDGTDEDSDDEL